MHTTAGSDTYILISQYIAVSGAVMWRRAVDDLTAAFPKPLLLSFLFLPFIIHLLCSRNNIAILTRSHTSAPELHITTKTSQTLSNAFDKTSQPLFLATVLSPYATFPVLSLT